MEEKNERKQKSEILFNKAIECYSKQNYEEALKYFKSCIKFYPNERAELFIRVCENNIPSNNNNTNTNNTSYKNHIHPHFLIITIVLTIQIIINIAIKVHFHHKLQKSLKIQVIIIIAVIKVMI